MKSKRTITLTAKNVEKIIHNLAILIVSMDRIGSTYYNKPRKSSLEMDKFFSEVNAFKLLSTSRRILSEAYNIQSSKANVARFEEKAENLPYWRYKKMRAAKNRHSTTGKL